MWFHDLVSYHFKPDFGSIYQVEHTEQSELSKKKIMS